MRTIPTRVGRTVGYQQVAKVVSSIFGDLEGAIFVVDPLFRHEPEAADFGVAAIGFAPAFDLESLAIGIAGEDEEAHALGVAFDVFEHFVAGSPVDGADKDVGFGFDKPPFEDAANGGRGVVGDENLYDL